MEYRMLTGTGLTVSLLGLGTMTFASQVEQKEAERILAAAVDGGVNFVDTADMYNGGKSEEMLGEILPPYRQKIVLASKVGYPLQSDAGPNAYGLSRKRILEGVEQSLRRLKTDYLDIYYMHHPVYGFPVEETLSAMSSLVSSGKVRYIGVSNQAAWQVCEALHISDKRGLIAPAVTQNLYNLLGRGIEQELLPFARKYGVGVVAYNPLAGGLLSGKHRFEQILANTRFDNNPAYQDRYWNKVNFEAVEELRAAADACGCGLLEMSLRFCAFAQGVSSVLVGVSKPEQLEANLCGVEKGPLSAETLSACDAVWAKLKGGAPQYNR